MNWTKKYWDAIDELYWTPKYIGLKSIPRKFWKITDESVSVSREMVNENGPLYRRTLFGNDYSAFVHRQEEMFNHIFSLALAVLPGDIIASLFGQFTSAGNGHDYTSIARELVTRHGWGKHDNVTYVDEFFVSESSILAVEIKFNAKTSLDQLAKYMVLLAAEYSLSKNVRYLDLLYIFNSDPVNSFRRQVGFLPGELNEDHYHALAAATKNKKIRQYIVENPEDFGTALSLTRISVIHWQDYYDRLNSYARNLGEGSGDRTLRRLIEGLAQEIESHPLSGVTPQ